MPLTDDLCPLGFAPHSVRPTRCKRCFRDYEEHKPKKAKDDTSKKKQKETTTTADNTASKVDTTKSISKKETESKIEAESKDDIGATASAAVVRRRRSNDISLEEPSVEETVTIRRSRVRPHSIASFEETVVAKEKPVSPKPSPSTSRRASATTSNEGEEREKKRSKYIQILSAQEVIPAGPPGENSDELTSPDVAFILQVKTSTRLRERDEEDTISVAPTDTTETTLTFGDTVEDLQAQIQTLKTQLEASDAKSVKLEKEAKEWQENKYQEVDREALERTASELLTLRNKVRELETINEDIKDENKVLKLETKEMQEDLDRRPSPDEVHRTIDELRSKLIMAESLYEELMDENEDFKREIRDLEDEIEELQDNFREDQADEYGILKKELEQTAKNCRILQFKLRKAEKRCDQLDTDKTQYEGKLKELIKSGHLDVNQTEKLNQMELELSTARDTSNRMHSEMESLQNKLKQLQEEKDILSKKKATDGNVSPEQGVQNRVPSPVARREQKPDSRFKDVSLELDSAQLLRDLYDTMERENDLKEQLRFTEEEAENFRKKMSFLEQENETLALQIKKMATSAKRGKDGRQRPPSREGNYDDDSGIAEDTDELTPSELKLQLELNEQETSVLRRKVEDLEVENISLQKQVRELQEKVEEKPTINIDLPTRPPTDPAQANIFYEQKVKVLENEAKELRMKIIDKDRENERLSSELMLKQRKGSKTIMTRSRSLDSDVQIDLKRQLQLVEQEASILRQRTCELENENDSLLAENKTLQIKSMKRGPLSPQEKLQAENMLLQAKIAKLEKKLIEEKELAAMQAGNTSEIGSMESLRNQLKQQESEINSLNVKVETLTSQNASLSAQIKSSGNKSPISATKRKKLPDSASKQEFKKAVEELEVEISQLNTAVQGKEEENKSLSAGLQEKTKVVQQLRDESKKNEEKFKKQLEEVNKNNDKLMKSLEEENKKVDSVNSALKELEKTKNKSLPKDEINKYTQQIDSLKKELDEEKTKNKESKSNAAKNTTNVSFESMRRVEEEKHKLQKEILEHQRRSSEADKKIADLEHCNKEAEKIQRNLKHEIDDLNTELDKEKNNLKKVDNRQTEVAMGWLKEREEMKKQMTDINKKTEQLQKDVDLKDKKINDLDQKVLEADKKRDSMHTNLKQREDDLKHVKENNSKLKSKLKELEEKFSKVDRDMEELTDKWKKLDLLYKKEKDDWTSKQSEFEIHVSADTKKIERLEHEYELQLRDRDEEVIRLREKLRKMDLDIKSKTYIAEDKPPDPKLEQKVNDLEEELNQEKQEYEDLTSKYEMLEEEHVVTKARLVMEKEEIENQVQSSQKECDQLAGELKTLRETFNMRQDTWIREKLDLQEKIKVIEDRFARLGSGNLDEEVMRLRSVLEEKNNRIEQYKKDDKQLREDVDKLKRLTQDLRSKLTDFERNRASGRYGTDLSPSSKKELQELQNNLMQAEVEELRTKLHQEERVHRSEVTALKMMNDVKIAQMQDEIQMLHIQIGKFRRERDTFKEMLEGAQRTIGDLKTDSIKRRGSYIEQETEDLKDKLQNLRKVVSTLQDQLDQSERANSRLKTEFITEKASWEIKVAEMQTKVNELEENTILQGGKSKIVGVKTKLELAWQKEREEQQRLLHESHRMAKELRQRVIDLENARDKERTEGKGQLEDLRKTVEADQAETQIKISELQADLLELRDAHSKMRTINDRVKRDRDKMERDRDDLRMKINQSHQFQADELASITGLVAELEKLKKLAPTILEDRPVSPSKTKPTIDTAALVKARDEFRTVLVKISRATEELRRAHGFREEERVRRNLSFRRALSATESDLDAKPPTAPTRGRKDDPLSRWQNPQRVTNYPQSPPSMVISPPRQMSQSTLHRKSLSLDQTLSWEEMEQSIWKSESDAGSSSSLQETAVVHNRSHSSGGEYASLSVPESGPSPLPRRRRRHQTSLTSLDSSAPSSRDTSVEKEDKNPPARPPSPKFDVNKDSSSMTLPKVNKDKRPASSIGTVRDKFRMFGKSKSSESPDSMASGSDPDIHKPKDFRAKISNIFRKSPSRTSSFDNDKSADAPSANSTLADKLKSLKPVSASDSKQKTQYRSTGALHTRENKDPSVVPNSTSSLPRRFLKKFNYKSKSIDDPTDTTPATSSSALKTHHETEV